MSLGVSPTPAAPTGFFSHILGLRYIPAVEPWVSWSVLLPSCSSWSIHMQMWHCPLSQSPPRRPGPVAATLPSVLSAHWPVSAPPTSVNECFFNSLVVGLPYSLISWQLWLFFVFQFVVVLVLVVRGGTVYLPMSPSWPEVPTLCLLETEISIYVIFLSM